MKKIFVLNLVLTTLIFASCSKDSDEMDEANPEEATIYVVGSNSRADNGLVPYQALLWVDGELTELTNGQTDAEAFSVFVSGSDVYVAGYEIDGNGVSIAKYWKNGVSVPLSDGSRYAIAYAIFIDGNDVYVAGSERSEIPGGRIVAKYWKNGTATSLTDGSKDASAFSLTISDNKIHVVGSESTGPGGSLIAKYWIDGNTMSLTDDTGDAWATDISINQGETYISLRQATEINGDDIQIASYWHDNQVTQLETNTSFAGAFGIHNDNDNLYVCGTSQPVGGTPSIRFWHKNDSGTAELSDNTLGDANSITKLNDTVYIAGSIFSGNSTLAVYWMNNEMIILPSDGFNFMQATDIYVN